VVVGNGENCITGRYSVLSLKRLSCLSGALFIAFLLTAVFFVVTPKPEYSQAPVISLSPTSGTPGTAITITGKGFIPQLMVEIRFGNIPVTADQSLFTDGKGSFRTNWVIPANIKPGVYVVTATAELTGKTTFTVTEAPPPRVIIPPVTIPPDLNRLPDLAILSIDYWFEENIRVLVLSAKIANVGDVMSPQTQVVVTNVDNILPVNTSAVRGLGPGESEPAEVRWEIPTGLSLTYYTFLVEVDPRGQIAEPNEENNRQPVEIQLFEKQGSGVPWKWVIPVLVVLAGIAGAGVKIALRKPETQLNIKTDNGVQRIELGGGFDLNAEIRLKAVMDSGVQTIKTKGSLISEKRVRR
jgi:hypothetical protein